MLVVGCGHGPVGDIADDLAAPLEGAPMDVCAYQADSTTTFAPHDWHARYVAGFHVASLDPTVVSTPTFVPDAGVTSTLSRAVGFGSTTLQARDDRGGGSVFALPVEVHDATTARVYSVNQFAAAV